MQRQAKFDVFDIPLAGFWRIKRDANLTMARAAWTAIRRDRGSPEELLRWNRPAEWAPYLLTQLRRIEKVLLWTLAVCAAFLQDVTFPKSRPRIQRTTRPRKAEDRNDGSTWRVSFATLPRIGLRYESKVKLPPPPRREIMRTLARKLESLRRVIIAPERVVLKLARRYRRRFVHIGWKPPKRPPPTDRRDYFDDMVALWEDARFEIDAAVRRLWDTS